LRLRGKNIRLSSPFIERISASQTTTSPNVLFTDPQAFRETVQHIASTPRPIHLEIGMGQGLFLSVMSRLYPDHVFIGIDRYDALLLRAWQKLIAVHEGLPPDNVIFFRHHLHDLRQLLPPHAVDTVYLHFSDPWPKKRHERRRLTHASYLWQYQEVLKESGRLVFKTDHNDFFAYSLASFETNQWYVKELYRDLQKLRQTRFPMFKERDTAAEFYEKLLAVSNLKSPAAGKAFWQLINTWLELQPSRAVRHDVQTEALQTEQMALNSMGYVWEMVWGIHPALLIPTEYELKFIHADRPIDYAEVRPIPRDR